MLTRSGLVLRVDKTRFDYARARRMQSCTSTRHATSEVRASSWENAAELLVIIEPKQPEKLSSSKVEESDR